MCNICPRNCRANRIKGERGFCGASNKVLLSSICVHYGEEPVLSGTKGALCVFLGSCNLKCVYCQNWQISQPNNLCVIDEIDVEELVARVFSLWLKNLTHNIEWVSPSHLVPEIREATLILKQKGVNVPFVYNTNAYDSLESLKSLDGLIDIYLPDLKYLDKDDKLGLIYSSAPNYSEHAKRAILEMYRQVGLIELNDSLTAKKGLLVRHLVLPNNLSNTKEVLNWLYENFGHKISISLMSQYKPCHKARNFSELSRPLNYREYEHALQYAESLGFENIFIQPYEEKPWDYYLPDFEKENPFE